MSIFSDIFPHAEYETYTQTTTNNTATTVASIPLATEQTAKIYVKAVARNSDGSKNGSFYSTALFYRNTGGDVTIVGTQNDINVIKTAGSTIDVTIVANTVTEAVDVKVTGETSQTISWEIKVANTVMSA